MSQVLLNFVVAHEYTHHIHRHCGPMRGASGIWTESTGNTLNAGIVAQAQELDADGYAAMLVLAHLARGERRASALELLGPPAPIRVQSLIQVTELWCNENGSVAKFWRSESELRRLFGAAKLASGTENDREWSAHVALLESPPFVEYRERLYDTFEALRRSPQGR